MANPGAMTTPNSEEVYDTTSKQILVTMDPVYTHPAIQNGAYVGKQPYTYLPLSILLTIINPLLGPLALVFAYLSNRAFKRGDLRYADKWSRYAFLTCMITIVASIIMYMAIASPSASSAHGEVTASDDLSGDLPDCRHGCGGVDGGQSS